MMGRRSLLMRNCHRLLQSPCRGTADDTAGNGRRNCLDQWMDGCPRDVAETRRETALVFGAYCQTVLLCRLEAAVCLAFCAERLRKSPLCRC